MVTKTDYDVSQVDAARSVMLELVHLLGEYRDDIVVVGGWVPALLIPQDKAQHIGSMDVDLALNHKTLRDPGYKSIRNLLLGRGYRQDNNQPFIFWRTVTVGRRSIEIEIDLLAGEYEGTAKKHRTQEIQDVRARKARGCELAFRFATEVSLEGTLPDGARDKATVRIAAIIPFLAMKGMAMASRLKEKDPWDVYYCVKNYPGGAEALSVEFIPHIGHSLIKEGLRYIAEKFASPDHVGPKSVADFEELTDLEERAVLQRERRDRAQQLGERALAPQRGDARLFEGGNVRGAQDRVAGRGVQSRQARGALLQDLQLGVVHDHPSWGAGHMPGESSARPARQRENS